MAGWGHLYVTAHGHWKSGHWAGETAQIGLRFAVWDQSAARGPIITLPDNGPVTLTSETRDTTNYTVTKTFEVDLVPGPGGPNNDAVLDDIVGDFATFMTSLNSYEAMPFSWTAFKIAPIELGTGKYLAPASTWTRKSPQEPSSATGLPPECSIAVSFRAAVVGKRGRGRMYIPALNPTAIGTDGTVAGPLLSSWPTAGATLARNLANLPNIDRSNSGMVIGSANSRTMVAPTECRVGNHVDVQRRRQHQAEEAYTSVSI